MLKNNQMNYNEQPDYYFIFQKSFDAVLEYSRPHMTDPQSQ